MSHTQIEKLLYFLEPIECSRGKIIFKVGDKPEGVYFIQDGSFEVSVPTNLHLKAENASDKFTLDAGSKFKLLKTSSI